MKKIILATLFLFFGSISTTQAFDGAFLDEVQVKIFLDGKVSARDAQKVLYLSSEAPQKIVILAEDAAENREELSSEDPTEQAIKAPVVLQTRRDFSFLKAPQKEGVETFFEISDRGFTTSLEIVRERQRRAREKAIRYRRLFQDWK